MTLPEELASRPPKQVEIHGYAEPEDQKAERQANAKAERLSRAQARQEQNGCAPRKQNESQRTARRKRDRDMYHAAFSPIWQQAGSPPSKRKSV